MSLNESFVSNGGRARRGESFPTRDEPQLDSGRGSDARVNERHRAERRTADVGPDRGVCGGESEDWFSVPKGEARYEFIERILKSQQYRRLSCGQKGIVRRSSSPNRRTTRVLAARDSAEQQWEV